jgi:signal transduction histidine kinase/DNA-binding NarL/FixJ family response regulator
MNNNLSWFNKVIKFPITNEDKNVSLERINSNTFLFCGCLISILSCIFNFLEDFSLILKIFTIFSSILLLILYSLSRFKNYDNIWLSAVTILSLLSISWFMNGGAIGSTSFMYLFMVIILNIIAKRHQQNRLFLLVLSNIILLYILEYYHGDVLVHPYPNRSSYYSDIIFVFILILVGSFFTTRFIKRSYDEGRNLIKERTEELELANEKRTNAFINLAHETKTPLTLITNYLEDYMRKNDKEENEELKLLKSSIGNLTKDIINFFDMEKIQKGIHVYNHHRLSDFSTLLKECTKLFQVFAAKKKIHISADISDHIFIKADPGSLLRIINNLIENAVKYTNEDGKIEISLKSTGSTIYFSVKDNGIGIPIVMQTKIFEPYFQINSEKANFQGMGLGLSIVKKILLDLNGEIAITSDPQNMIGTTITISLPAYQKSENEQVTEFPVEGVNYFEVEKLSINELPVDENNFTIMIVEDNMALLKYMVEALQKKYNIHFALNGEAAVEKLKTITHLDLIVSDVMMDNGDGYFLYQHIQQSKRFSHVPFIFLTAKYTGDDRMKGITMGAIDYISKPVSIHELDKKINSFLNNLSNQRNAIITQAYHSLMNPKEIKETKEIETCTFQLNCNKYNLTSRETDVIRLMMEGKINKEIASELFISIDTVKKHIQHVYEKIGVSNKFELLKKMT